MFVGNTSNPVSIPEQNAVAPKQSSVQLGESSIDFDKMLVESNGQIQKEIEKEKQASSDGELHIGEAKNDRQFREQLEKITGKKQDGPKNKLDQHDYLTLLVTQLKYQDPSKPMEHYEMASQMAQFNTVEQLVGVNKSLTNMSKSQSEGKMDKLSQYLDKYVEVEGSNLKLNADKSTTTARFDLSAASPNTSIDIKDSQGKVVKSLTLGSLQMGAHEIDWNGLDNKGQALAPGNYSYVVHASSDDGKAISTKSSYLVKVTGVSDILGGGKLETTAGPIDPAKVLAIRTHEQQKIEKKTLTAISGDAQHGIH